MKKLFVLIVLLCLLIPSMAYANERPPAPVCPEGMITVTPAEWVPKVCVCPEGSGRHPLDSRCYKWDTRTIPPRLDRRNPVDEICTDAHWSDPVCGEPEPEPTLGRPLFNMQLLIKYSPPVGWLPYCMAIADGGVSIDWQLKWCGWVADNHPCGGLMYDNDVWACDRYGYNRLPLKDLLKVIGR